MERRGKTDDYTSINKLRGAISRWLHIDPMDDDLIDFTFAVHRSNAMPGDPLWGLIIDASGGGKTELLRSYRERDDCYFLSSMTEKTLMSGFRDPLEPYKDPSLLPQLNGKVLIIKDLSPLLSMRRETRNAIISALRDCYDGFSDMAYGNVGRVSYEVKFSLLAASTLALEQFESVHQELGERFVKFRVRSLDARAKVERAIRNVGRDNNMRQDIQAAIATFLESLPSHPSVTTIPEFYIEPLTDLSDFTAVARSHVPRDRKHVLQYRPKPEIATRLGKELGKLFLALADVRGKNAPDDTDLRTVVRVAEDCLPPNRYAILRFFRDLYLNGKSAQTDEIAKAADLPESTTKQTLEDLIVLGLLVKETKLRQGSVNVTNWRLKETWGERLIVPWAIADSAA